MALINKLIENWKNISGSYFIQNIFKPVFIPPTVFIVILIIAFNYHSFQILVLNNLPAVIGILMLIAAFFIIWLLPSLQTKKLREIKRDKRHSEFEIEKERIKLRDDTRKTLAQVIGGAFFVFSLFVAYNTFQFNRENQFNLKYIEAIKLIGSENQTNRIGGLLALEDISKNSLRDYPTIFEFLSIHLKETSDTVKQLNQALAKAKENPQSGSDKSANVSNNNLAAVNSDTGANTNTANTASQKSNGNQNGNQIDEINSKIEVLKSEMILVIKILKRRSKFNEPTNFILGLSGVELANADLKDANFSYADFQEANFPEADFSNTDLTETNFSHANLDQTRFNENTVFYKTNMKGADLTGTNITEDQLYRVIIDFQTTLPQEFKHLRDKLLVNSFNLLNPKRASNNPKN